MSAARTFAGLMLQLAGILVALGALSYLGLGGAALILGMPLGAVILAVVGAFTFGVGLGLFFLGSIVKSGGRKK